MSDPESISSGVGIPNWMRTRIEKTDATDGITFSPPAHDESFFYIRYPVKQSSLSNASPESGISHITSMLHAAKGTQQKVQLVDFSKHTEPCKRFLKETDPSSSIQTAKNPSKSFGTDDGFKGPGAACGNSIIKVAQQMVSSRSLSSRGFQFAHFDEGDSAVDNTITTRTIEDQQLQTRQLIQPNLIEDSDVEYPAQGISRLMIRRGSKSLPTSPLGSPKSMRKYQPNPYFTSTLSSGSTTEGRGWLLSSLLGIQREAISTTSVKQIEEEFEPIETLSKATTVGRNKTGSTKDLPQIPLKAKPSELREMNFWTPTSM